MPAPCNPGLFFFLNFSALLIIAAFLRFYPVYSLSLYGKAFSYRGDYFDRASWKNFILRSRRTAMACERRHKWLTFIKLWKRLCLGIAIPERTSTKALFSSVLKEERKSETFNLKGKCLKVSFEVWKKHGKPITVYLLCINLGTISSTNQNGKKKALRGS